MGNALGVVGRLSAVIRGFDRRESNPVVVLEG